MSIIIQTGYVGYFLVCSLVYSSIFSEETIKMCKEKTNINWMLKTETGEVCWKCTEKWREQGHWRIAVFIILLGLMHTSAVCGASHINEIYLQHRKKYKQSKMTLPTEEMCTRIISAASSLQGGWEGVKEEISTTRNQLWWTKTPNIQETCWKSGQC